MKLKIVMSCDLNEISFVLVPEASAPYQIYFLGGPSLIPLGHEFVAKKGF